ncbi:MAG: UDP-N-acetylglucosamine--N-acetylmuramyl-(pentapeptide) pyrophosphoryl-undecaprenol N-acetylglucosamine transferase [Ruminococcaceae bacterium]|nr:UDP-N-acetylglucosamine--N-acetylmuramyl-(pentapeptide) pyrophosphoryl-undecaprenol N-acetylglucosamine transferase [Oscillospiraceae bacterium]
MRFLLVCGGTAGHINPALAIAGELGKALEGSEFLFVGGGREMEKRLIPKAGYDLKNVTISGFARGISPRHIKANFKTLKNLIVSAKESENIIREFKPDAVIGTGGYVCYPVLKKAAQMGIPTILHESNAVPGITTKMLSGKVDKIMVAFPDVKKYYKKPENVLVTGTPVRQDFAAMTKAEARKRLGIDNRPLIVSFWGSLGASVMNGYMVDFIAENCRSGALNHIHATGGGEAGLKKLKDALQERGITNIPKNVDLRPYIDNMGTVMTAADVVMCRAGASTIAELTMMGKPSILVPSPNVTNNHQEKNARAVERSGGAKVFLEPDCSGEILYKAAVELTGDRESLAKMNEGAASLGFKDCTSKIAEIIISLIN